MKANPSKYPDVKVNIIVERQKMHNIPSSSKVLDLIQNLPLTLT